APADRHQIEPGPAALEDRRRHDPTAAAVDDLDVAGRDAHATGVDEASSEHDVTAPVDFECDALMAGARLVEGGRGTEHQLVLLVDGEELGGGEQVGAIGPAA